VVQLARRGFSIVEVLSNCPVGWGMTPVESIERLRDVVVKAYPVGVLADRTRPAEMAATTGGSEAGGSAAGGDGAGASRATGAVGGAGAIAGDRARVGDEPAAGR
jgi:hypothetical protein